jgi:hypothetical protein
LCLCGFLFRSFLFFGKNGTGKIAMGQKIKINNEFLPERCDICHQQDCFDPETGYCGRCIELIDDNLHMESRWVEQEPEQHQQITLEDLQWLSLKVAVAAIAVWLLSLTIGPDPLVFFLGMAVVVIIAKLSVELLFDHQT